MKKKRQTDENTHLQFACIEEMSKTCITVTEECDI